MRRPKDKSIIIVNPVMRDGTERLQRLADRPKAALLLWFFGDFRCGALLFVVIYVIYKYKNR